MSKIMVGDLEQARSIILNGLQGQAVRVYLFGSQATGKTHRISDIDVAILPLTSLPIGLLSEIRQALEESNILSRVDLVDLSEVDPIFRKRVLEEGILWKE
jgi:uncharacterized protein